MDGRNIVITKHTAKQSVTAAKIGSATSSKEAVELMMITIAKPI
jgi:hypothetical protein